MWKTIICVKLQHLIKTYAKSYFGNRTVISVNAINFFKKKVTNLGAKVETYCVSHILYAKLPRLITWHQDPGIKIKAQYGPEQISHCVQTNTRNTFSNGCAFQSNWMFGVRCLISIPAIAYSSQEVVNLLYGLKISFTHLAFQEAFHTLKVSLIWGNANY